MAYRPKCKTCLCPLPIIVTGIGVHPCWITSPTLNLQNTYKDEAHVLQSIRPLRRHRWMSSSILLLTRNATTLVCAPHSVHPPVAPTSIVHHCGRLRKATPNVTSMPITSLIMKTAPALTPPLCRKRGRPWKVPRSKHVASPSTLPMDGHMSK